MFNFFKKWWRKRQLNHYLKSRWHLFTDAVLVLMIIGFVINLIVIETRSKPKVDTTPVGHATKVEGSVTAKSLVVKSDISKSNIYAGRSFDVNLVIENQGVSDLTDINLTPSFVSDYFTVSKLENNTIPSDIQVKNNAIIISKLSAGKKIVVDLSVTVSAKANSPRLVSWLFKTVYTENNQKYSTSNDLADLKLVTNLSLGAEAYYNSQLGDQLGSGPIPPMVGLPTNYWIFFEAENQGNDLSNLVVTAKLPEAVTLSNDRTLSAGDFTYNESQRRVSWTVKKVGIDGDRYQVGFEVQLLPTDKQIDLKPLLLTNISYLATDAYTGEKLSGKLPDIDTELTFDSINKGQGVVVK